MEKEIRPWVFERLKLTGGPSTVIYGRRGRLIDRSNLSKCAFFFRIGRVTPRRETVVRDRVVNGHRPIMYARSRRVGDSDKRSAISRATYRAGSKSVRRRDSPLLRALLLRSGTASSLLFSTVDSSSSVRCVPFYRGCISIRSTYTSGSTLSVRMLNVLLL